MPKSVIFKFDAFKLSYLLEKQYAEKEKYEQAAILLSYGTLQQLMLALAKENDLFATALIEGVKVLRLTHPVFNKTLKANLNPVKEKFSTAITEDEIIVHCCASEKQVINAYRDVLNEPLLPSILRALLRQQLNSTMYAFVQLKLIKNYEDSFNGTKFLTRVSLI